MASVYTTSGTGTAITNATANKVNIVTVLPTGKTATDTVTFQDLIDMGIIKLP